MDKFEYELKVEQIEKLIGREDYSTAKKIADTMEWKKEKDSKLLSKVAELYAQAGDIDKALTIYNYAYNVSARGLLILERMTELAIIYGQIELAQELCEEYKVQGAYEPDYELFRFQISEAKGEDYEKRIPYLERYCKSVLDEEAIYRLAWMYDRAGRKDDCIRLCDFLIDFFCFGESVDNAVKLKTNYEPLTKYQERIIADAAEMEENYLKVTGQLTEAAKEETAPQAGEPKKNEVHQQAEQIRQDSLLEEQESDLGRQVSEIVEQEIKEKQEFDMKGLAAEEELMAQIDLSSAVDSISKDLETESQVQKEADSDDEDGLKEVVSQSDEVVNEDDIIWSNPEKNEDIELAEDLEEPAEALPSGELEEIEEDELAEISAEAEVSEESEIEEELTEVEAAEEELADEELSEAEAAEESETKDELAEAEAAEEAETEEELEEVETAEESEAEEELAKAEAAGEVETEEELVEAEAAEESEIEEELAEIEVAEESETEEELAEIEPEEEAKKQVASAEETSEGEASDEQTASAEADSDLEEVHSDNDEVGSQTPEGKLSGFMSGLNKFFTEDEELSDIENGQESLASDDEEPEDNESERTSADDAQTERKNRPSKAAGVDTSSLELMIPEGSFKVVCSDNSLGEKYAIELVRLSPEEDRCEHVAKVSSKKLNTAKFSYVEQQLENDILMVTDAGQLSNGALDNIYAWMKKSMENKVIFVDNANALDELEKRRPKLMKRISGTYEYEKKTTEEWLELVNVYVDENDCVLADDAYQLFVDYLNDKEENGEVVLGINLKDAVQDAMHEASKLSFGNLLSAALSTKYNEDGLLILRDRHFL